MTTFMNDTAFSWNIMLTNTRRMPPTAICPCKATWGKPWHPGGIKGVEGMFTAISGLEGQFQSWSSLLCTIIPVISLAALTYFRWSESNSSPSVIACLFFHIIFKLMSDLHSKAGLREALLSSHVKFLSQNIGKTSAFIMESANLIRCYFPIAESHKPIW